MVRAALFVTGAAESAVLVGGSRFVGLAGLVLVLLASAAWCSSPRMHASNVARVSCCSRLAWLVAAHSVFLVSLYEFEVPAHPTLEGVLATMRSTVIEIGAWTAVVASLVILFGVHGRSV